MEQLADSQWVSSGPSTRTPRSPQANMKILAIQALQTAFLLFSLVAVTVLWWLRWVVEDVVVCGCRKVTQTAEFWQAQLLLALRRQIRTDKLDGSARLAIEPSIGGTVVAGSSKSVETRKPLQIEPVYHSERVGWTDDGRRRSSDYRHVQLSDGHLCAYRMMGRSTGQLVGRTSIYDRTTLL
jgi:hypothetical protein